MKLICFVRRRGEVLIILLLLGGCTRNSDQHSAASIWASSHSTPSERIQAVNELIPPGTDKEEIERVLGKGTLVHFHSLNTTHEEETLEYPVPGGAISLILRPAGSGRLSFVTAVFTPLQKSSQRKGAALAR